MPLSIWIVVSGAYIPPSSDLPLLPCRNDDVSRPAWRCSLSPLSSPTRHEAYLLLGRAPEARQEDPRRYLLECGVAKGYRVLSDDT